MTGTVLAISIAYVVMGVVLLGMGLTSRFAWWLKAVAIIVTSVFFVEVFYATKGLLGWPGTERLPQHFQLLWARAVEPDAKVGDPGSIYLWVEEIDENNVPSGVPRSYRLPYSRPLAERASKARDQIMKGNPQQGSAEDLSESGAQQEIKVDAKRPGQQAQEAGGVVIDADQAKLLQQAQRVEFGAMPLPTLPPKLPQ
jgi:hypothetical protein